MTSDDELRDRLRDQWNVAAARWEKWDPWLDAMSADLTRWMCDTVGLDPGLTVLDLGCGTGALAAIAARRVAPGGRVIATDLSPGMVEVARRKMARLGLDHVEAQVMAIEQLELPDLSVDAVTCRFVLMFSTDPARAAREIHRVLRPGGRAAIAVWGDPARNPFFTTSIAVAARFVPTPPADPQAPGVFRLADPAELDRVLRAAAFDDVAIAETPFQFRYDSLEEYWTIQSDLSAALRNAIATLPAERIRELKAALLEEVSRFERDGAIVFDGVTLCARLIR